MQGLIPGLIPAILGDGMEISDRTALDLEHRVLDHGESEASDAIDLAVESTEVFVDALFPVNTGTASSSSNCFGDHPDHGSSPRAVATEKTFVGDKEHLRNDRFGIERQDLAGKEENEGSTLGGSKFEDKEDQAKNEKQTKDGRTLTHRDDQEDDIGNQTLMHRDGQVTDTPHDSRDQTLAPTDEEQAQDPCHKAIASEEQASDQTLAPRDDEQASDQALAYTTGEEKAGDSCDDQTLPGRDEGQARDYCDDTDDQTNPARNGPTCSRSSSFSERSVESCDSFVSAESRLEPHAEREELFKMFETFDENGDGRISCGELGNTMRKLGFEVSEAELESMVVAVDSDGDGFVDFEEFLDLYRTLYYDEQHKAKFDADNERELQDAFSVFDKNKDGYISVKELQAVLSSLGLKEGAKLSDCQKMIKAVDADGDGRVSFEEFRTMMSSTLFQQVGE